MISADLERVLRGCSVEAERHDELRAEGRKFRPVVPLR
jgi:hypothetical protein